MLTAPGGRVKRHLGVAGARERPHRQKLYRVAKYGFELSSNWPKNVPEWLPKKTFAPASTDHEKGEPCPTRLGGTPWS